MTNSKKEGLDSRKAALDLLDAVLIRRRPLDEAVEAHAGLRLLEPRDRGFARLLAATVLRRLGALDALVRGCLGHALPPKARPAGQVMRLGAAQLLYLGQPAHAVVDTAVDLSPPPYRKLVNAVLRRLAREGAARLAGLDADRLSIPDWLWESWVKDWGLAAARRIASASLAEAPLDLTVKSGAAGWAEKLGGIVLPSGTVRLAKAGAVTELEGFAEGGWWVQDAAAALPAQILGDVRGLKTADLCAAPGGKTAQLAQAGALVTAVDRGEARLSRLQGNLARLGLEAQIVTADAAQWQPPEKFDAVLLDAPCSATGTLRRHPDLTHLKKPEDAAKLAQAQLRLLHAAARMLKPGGRLVYAVCSLAKAEGEEVCARALAEGAPLRLDPIRPEEIAGLPEAVTAEGFLRSFPDHWGWAGGLDGFFAARFTAALT
jgi:16S rRNA (cytosine967-C5)-methyltransferase